MFVVAVASSVAQAPQLVRRAIVEGWASLLVERAEQGEVWLYCRPQAHVNGFSRHWLRPLQCPALLAGSAGVADKAAA